MKKILIIAVLIFILFLGFIFRSDIYSFYLKLFGSFSELEKEFGEIIKEAEKKIVLPPPLRFAGEEAGLLSRSQVIALTNIERQKTGLSLLKENSKLNSSAEIKAEDMLLRQYFEHSSPSGEQVSDLAQRAGYDFIILGENLAMGNFKDDKALVHACMDSPGHRENILNPNYSEIGVSVIKGSFEGRTVWMAVQHFALPLDTCSEADETIRAIIEINEKKVERIEQLLEAMKGNLKNKREVEEYNRIVSDHNILVEQNRVLIEEYNRQASAFNDCLADALK